MLFRGVVDVVFSGKKSAVADVLWTVAVVNGSIYVGKHTTPVVSTGKNWTVLPVFGVGENLFGIMAQWTLR